MKKNKKITAFHYVNLAVSLALRMVITVFLLYGAGAWIDTQLKTMPVFIMIFLLMAIAVNIYMLAKTFTKKH
jgi:F0F1-type ATP synthase assembly protein I